MRCFLYMNRVFTVGVVGAGGRMSALLGVENGNSKNVGRRKFWLGLGVSGAFLIGLESLF